MVLGDEPGAITLALTLQGGVGFIGGLDFNRAAHSHSLTVGRQALGQSLKHYGHKGDAVGETKKSRADSEQLALRRMRDYIAIANGRERHSLIVEVVDKRSVCRKRLLGCAGQEIISDSKACQNAADKKDQSKNPIQT